ncbi:MAG: ATP-binding protein [Anaerolineales bacterium]
MDPRVLITVARLRNSEIFAELDEEDLVSIAGFCREENYQDGHIVLVEGQPANSMFIIERGKVALEKKVQIGRHTTPRNATIDYVGPGQIAGFSSLTPPYLYATSAVCTEPTRVLYIDADQLREYLREQPKAGYPIMLKMARLIGFRYRGSIDTLTYFLSIVSHELRSPLAAIENYLQTMLGGFAGELTQKQDKMIKRCVVRVTDLRALISDVVDLARMRPEQIQADFEWFDPGDTGTESIEDVRLAAAEKNIRIRVAPPAKFEPIVGGHRRLRQVFTNILNNAIKFSPPDSTIIFRAWYEADQLIFEVEDEGPGIPTEEMDEVFKDFFRASNVGDTPGMGLGLSIAHNIIEAHNGEIVVRNVGDESGKTGACVRIVIPRNLMTPEMRKREYAKDLQQIEQ